MNQNEENNLLEFHKGYIAIVDKSGESSVATDLKRFKETLEDSSEYFDEDIIIRGWYYLKTGISDMTSNEIAVELMELIVGRAVSSEIEVFSDAPLLMDEPYDYIDLEVDEQKAILVRYIKSLNEEE